MAELLADQGRELDSHELLLEDARVAEDLLRSLEVAHVMLAVLRAELLRCHRLGQILRDVGLAGLLLLRVKVRLLLADHLQVGQVAIS